MPRYVSFLRGINLGNRRVKMDRLRQIYESLPFEDVKTFIASGNVLFNAKSCDPLGLETLIEQKLAAELGYEVETSIRTPEQLQTVVGHEPFDAALLTQAHALHVTFLRDELSEKSKAVLASLETEEDLFRCLGRELYWLCLGSVARPSFSQSAFSKALGGKGTARNIKTIRSLVDLC